MALKVKISAADFDGLDAHFKGEYERVGSEYMLTAARSLQTELESANARVAEFRENNIVFKRERDDAMAGKTAAEKQATELAEKMKGFEAKGAKSPDDITTIVQAAVAASLTPVTERLATVEASNKQKDRDLQRGRVRNVFTEIAAKKKVKRTALNDFLDKAESAFVIDPKSQQPIMYREDGVTPVYSKTNPTMPITPDEWVDDLAKDKDYLFDASSGGGATDGDGRQRPNLDPNVRVVPQKDAWKHLEDIAKGKVRVGA